MARIAVLDSHPVIRDTVAMILGYYGHAVIVVERDCELPHILHEGGGVDLVIADTATLTETRRSGESLGHVIPLILIAACPEESLGDALQAEAREGRATRTTVLPKPFTSQSLGGVVQSALAATA